MNLRVFYATLLLVLVTVIALSIVWEFALEDRLLPKLSSHHEPEDTIERWEFVASAAFFSGLALVVPGIVGTRIIRRDQVLRQSVTRLSQEDDLTGFYNRRRINELLEDEIQRASRYQTRFCVILADIDHFKGVNDRFGHQAGDRVLANVAEAIHSMLRKTDLVGRWGGEEFLIILLETGLDGGYKLAEKIRTRVSSLEFADMGQVTASFGITTFVNGDDIESIIARADAGLYTAKRSGRNRVEKVTAAAKVVPDLEASN